VWRVEGEKKRRRRTSGGREGWGGWEENVRWIREEKEGVRERLGEIQREGYHGKELGASGRREFAVERLLGEVAGERVLPALQGEGFYAGGMVARQTAPGCTWCVRTEKGSSWTKRARAEAPRTGVYVISALNVRGTGRTGCARAQGSFFADVTGLVVVSS